MDRSLLIAVFVPTTNERGEDFKGEIGERATGYPVGKDLILTACHILHPKPPNQRDPRYRVAIRWHDFRSSDDADWIEISDDDIIWEGQGELDAALIRCRRPPDAVGWGIVSRDRPRDWVQWIGDDLPRSAEYDNRRNPSSFIGKVCFKATPEPYFELTVDTILENEESWKGVSGMPVFVDHKILGVVRSVLPNFSANKLHATPMWKLLEDESFCEKLYGDELVKRVGSVKSKLARMLVGSREAVDALSKQKQLRIGDEMVGLDDGQRANWLAGLLLQTDIRTVISALRAAHRSLCEEGGDRAGPTGRAADILVKVSQVIVPALYDYGIVHWVDSHRGDGSAALVRLPVSTITVAEIIMAAVDGRETRYYPRRHEEDQPVGALSLPHLPECGIFANLDKTTMAAHEHLRRKLCLEEEATKFRRQIDDGLFALYKPGPGEPEIKLPRQRIQAIANQLRRTQRDKGVTFYMVFLLPDDEDEKTAMLNMIQSLKDGYKEAILFFGLDYNFDRQEEEKNLFDPFYRMLPMQDSGSSSLPSAQSALEVWCKKLAFLETELAKAADSGQKFKIQQDIEEAKAKIREHGDSV